MSYFLQDSASSRRRRQPEVLETLSVRKRGLPLLGRPGLRAFVAGGVAAGVAIAIAAPVLALVHRQDFPFERAFGNAAVTIVARIGGGGAANPLGPGAQVTDAGRFAFTGSCATCHGANGDGKGIFGRDTYPDATDLTGPDAVSKTDAELFWIIKNGLAFTAMPAFARQYNDGNVWAMVSYVRALQEKKATPVKVPPPTAAQLAFADPHGGQTQRGAAIYFAQGCADCHGAIGNGPGELALSGPSDAAAIRGGGLGMPTYPPDRLSAGELSDLLAFVATLRGRELGR